MELPQHLPPHIVIVPTPGMGHLIPLIEFSKRILQTTPFKIYFIIPTLRPPTPSQKSALAVLPECQASYTLVNLDDLPSEAKIESKMSVTLVGSLPAIRSHLRDLQGSNHELTALVVDLFGTDVLDIAPEFEMKRYLFFPSTGMCLSLFLHLPYLDRQVTCEYRDMHDNDMIELPGCTPVQGIDLLDPAQDRNNDAYKWLLHHTTRYNLAEGIIVNSFNELEEGALRFLQKGEPGRPPVYPIGPLIRGSGDEKTDGSQCLKWLDEQPRGSVLFVSFGSGGTLSHNQIIELARGFEMSNQRFLWVFRTPNDKTLNATYFSGEGDRNNNPLDYLPKGFLEKTNNNPLDYLPKGFLEKTKEMGLVIPNWAPQVEVLSHAVTRGFLTHCGWNSILESVTQGVPMIAWPLYAEQKMNAAMLTNGLKIALRPNADENGLVGRGEIALVVKGIMEGDEGKEIQNRMNRLKDAASSAVGKDGSSTKSLHQVFQMWKSH